MKYAVIVAGGKGLRMGNAIPKQFLPIGNIPILAHTINAFINTFNDINIILVLPNGQLSYAQIILPHLSKQVDITLTEGGETRFHSVKNGLELVPDNAVVFIHDGARPFVSQEVINRCYEGALQAGSAIPTIAVTDSVRMIENEESKAIDRNLLRIIQTPQTFRSEIIKPAFQQNYTDSFTDEATVLEAYGYKVCLVEGDKKNIKITSPEDMILGEAYIKAISL